MLLSGDFNTHCIQEGLVRFSVCFAKIYRFAVILKFSADLLDSGFILNFTCSYNYRHYWTQATWESNRQNEKVVICRRFKYESTENLPTAVVHIVDHHGGRRKGEGYKKQRRPNE